MPACGMHLRCWTASSPPCSISLMTSSPINKRRPGFVAQRGIQVLTPRVKMAPIARGGAGAPGHVKGGRERRRGGGVLVCCALVIRSVEGDTVPVMHGAGALGYIILVCKMGSGVELCAPCVGSQRHSVRTFQWGEGAPPASHHHQVPFSLPSISATTTSPRGLPHVAASGEHSCRVPGHALT